MGLLQKSTLDAAAEVDFAEEDGDTESGGDDQPTGKGKAQARTTPNAKRRTLLEFLDTVPQHEDHPLQAVRTPGVQVCRSPAV